jgi:hypothetical protein
MRFLRAFRFERMWGLLGLALSIAYSTAQKEHHQYERLSRRYKDGRKDSELVLVESLCPAIVTRQGYHDAVGRTVS